MFQVAQNRIVLEQMSQSGGAGQVIDGHKFDIRIVNGGAQHVASDAAKAVNANFDCHGESNSPRMNPVGSENHWMQKSATGEHLHQAETNQVSRGRWLGANV